MCQCQTATMQWRGWWMHHQAVLCSWWVAPYQLMLPSAWHSGIISLTMVSSLSKSFTMTAGRPQPGRGTVMAVRAGSVVWCPCLGWPGLSRLATFAACVVCADCILKRKYSLQNDDALFSLDWIILMFYSTLTVSNIFAFDLVIFYDKYY